MVEFSLMFSLNENIMRENRRLTWIGGQNVNYCRYMDDTAL